MKRNHLYLGFLLLFAFGLCLCGIAAGRLVSPAAGETKPLGTALIMAWANAAAIPFVAGFGLMLVGGIGARRVTATSTLQGGASDEDPALVLGQIKTALSTVDTRSDEAAGILSEILEEQVARVVDQRDRLISQYGVGAYAEFAGDFASFERNAARAWSAMTDGVFHEAEQSLLVADAALERATASYEKLVA